MNLRGPLQNVDFNSNINLTAKRKYDIKEEIEYGLCIKEERRNLVEQIKKKKEDPEVWRELLAYDMSHKQSKETISKLFQKATKELPPLNLRKNPAYINLWLHYILFLCDFATEEAKNSIKYLRNQRIGLEDSGFYLVWAQVEFLYGNPQKSIPILEKGSSKRSVHGFETVKEALECLKNGQDISKFQIPSLSKSLTEEPTIIIEKKDHEMGDNEETQIIKVEPSQHSSSSFYKSKKREVVVVSDQEDDEILTMLKKKKMKEMNMKENLVSINPTPTPIVQVNKVTETPSSSIVPSPSNQDLVSVNKNNYTKISMIGKGGSGKVYKVFDAKKNIYALKKVKLKGCSQQITRGFMNEVLMLKHLRGKKNIVQLIDYEARTTEGYLYLVMECGDTDLSLLLRSSNLNENQIRLYWEQMLEAVQTIHEEKIIHSDLKPANFLLVKGIVKLIDFGIANRIQNDTTNIVRDNQVGTVNYMSPEAINENPSATEESKAPKFYFYF
jgi:hypothetical protein